MDTWKQACESGDGREGRTPVSTPVSLSGEVPAGRGRWGEPGCGRGRKKAAKPRLFVVLRNLDLVHGQ